MKSFVFCLCIPLLFACRPQNNDTSAMLGLDWEGLNLEEFRLSFGDEILFESEEDSIRGLIVDFSHDEGGRWYGICFLRGKELFGTRIPVGFVGNSCVDLLDVCYLNEQGLKHYKRLTHIALDPKKMSVGSEGFVSNLADLTEQYKRGISQRQKPPTPCREDLLDPDRVIQRYHSINDFKK